MHNLVAKTVYELLRLLLSTDTLFHVLLQLDRVANLYVYSTVIFLEGIHSLEKPSEGLLHL